MKFNHFCLLAGILLIILGITVFAQAQVELSGAVFMESDTNGVCMEECTTIGTQIKLTNSTNIRKCFNFDAESIPFGLVVSITPNEVCLNKNESTYIMLNANSCGADERSYRVNVFDTDSNAELWFDYRVGSCSSFDGFTINEFDGVLCAGEERKVSVIVKNNSSSAKRIALNADNSMILPYFEKSFIDLASGQQKTVNLVINANNLHADFYNISLTGTAGEYRIHKNLEARIVDCTEIPQRTFALNVPQVCFDVRKGQEFESQFSITRQSNLNSPFAHRQQEFFLTLSGMPSELSYNSVLLVPNEGKSIPFTVYIPADAPTGHTLLSIFASDGPDYGSFTEQKSLCLNVLGESNAGLVVITQAKDIALGSAEVFQLQLTNTGDFDANFNLAVSDVPGGISAVLTDTRVFLSKGQSKVIYVSVSASPFAHVRENQFIKVSVTGPVSLSSKIYFNVKESVSFEDLEILSATKQVDMKGNSEAVYDIVIRNNTESTLQNVMVSFENIPMDMNIESVLLSNISPGVPITVSGTISAGDINGYFTPSFVVSSGQLMNKKVFAIYVASNPKPTGITGLFAGFFSLGGVELSSLFGVLIGSIFLAVLLIILVSVIIIIMSWFSRSKKKEAWMRNNN
jgi:uncharacterized membrane protein